MKKFYSIVLMATALLIGTNVWAGTQAVNSKAAFESAWKAANVDVIQLTNDITIDHTLWLGTEKMGDNAKTVTIDLNGHVLTNNAEVKQMFIISHGELNIISSTGKGTIVQEKGDGSSQELFRVLGSTYKTVNPKTATSGYYSHLTIGENVTVQAKVQNAIVVDIITSSLGIANAWSAGGVTITNASGDRATNIFNDGSYGVAYGARVDVYGSIDAKKYAFKTNGNLGLPGVNPTVSGIANFKASPTAAAGTYSVEKADSAYTPFVYIHKTADLRVPATTDNTKKPVAVYCSGYARWLIEGTCVGSTGVYIKSGEVTLNDAVIESNYTGDYVAADKNQAGSGVVAQGSGIVIESKDAYSGGIDVEIGGDTKVSATNGYAIDESVHTGSNDSKVSTITINGGTFAGGKVGVDPETGEDIEGTITISEETVNKETGSSEAKTVTINGLSVTGTGVLVTEENDGVKIGGQTLAEFFSSQGTESHVTPVPDGDGSYTYVITPGAAPVPADEKNNWAAVALYQYPTNPIVVWTGTGDPVNTNPSTNNGYGIIESGTVKLGELQMNAGTDATHMQVLVINDGACLNVQSLIMNNFAQIIVNPGGKLIVEAKQGIIAPSVDNIVLQNEDGKRSIFLFNPEVSSNKHPNATVELITNSWNETTPEVKAQWEMFGIPTHTAVKSISCEKTDNGTKTVYSSIAVYENAAWNNLGFIGGTYTIPVDKLNKPFIAYNLLANRARGEEAPKIKITGELVGNENASLNAYMKWTMFANSYTGEIDGPAFANMLETKAQYVDSYFYVAKASGLGSLTWEPFDAEEKGAKILPMQAFLLNNKGAYAEVNSLNYKKMVYNPAMGITSDPAGAPRHNAVRESTAKMHVVVTSETGTWDKLKLRENANNVKACEKFMNEDVNIYAVVDEKAAIVNAENLDGTYVGFSTVNGGKFTLSFANVEGRDFTLVDHETGAQVLMVEGNTYEFNADANSENDYRFEIVETAKVTTAIENTEAVKSAKGIYTITGQYVGEMSAWNALPAGVYVVNGEKRVK